MTKYIALLLIGIAIGYGYGFRDAKRHQNNVVVRVVQSIGGSNRENFKNDLDTKAERAGR